MYFIIHEPLDLESELEIEMSLPPELCGGESIRVRGLGSIAHVERMATEGRIGIGVSIKHFEFIRGK